MALRSNHRMKLSALGVAVHLGLESTSLALQLMRGR